MILIHQWANEGEVIERIEFFSPEDGTNNSSFLSDNFISKEEGEVDELY